MFSERDYVGNGKFFIFEAGADSELLKSSLGFLECGDETQK